MSRQAHGVQAPDRSARQSRRDAALARVARVRTVTILGTGALTAALAGVVSAAAPGRTLGARAKVASAVVTPRRGAAVPSRMPPLARPAQLGLRAPGQPPQPAPAQPAPAQPAPAPSAAPPAAPAPAQPAAPAPATPSPSTVVSGGS